MVVPLPLVLDEPARRAGRRAATTTKGEALMQVVNPYLLYEDCDAALDFLARAFGFEEVLRYTGEGGYVNHAEMKVGKEGRIYMGDPGDQYKSPKRLGQETCGIYVYVDDDVDGRCERAREAGATITEEPTDQGYGE